MQAFQIFLCYSYSKHLVTKYLETYEAMPKVVKYYVTCFIILKYKNIGSICAPSFAAVSNLKHVVTKYFDTKIVVKK